ncbi:MAG: DNA starvation/stationary phase protection protein [Clostridia bacterium]|nr:DNA starvation/stationary phase protection protein [Clostridia bacterium]
MENLLKDLNIFLSDLNVFYRKLQNYHWNIKGRSFFIVHPKLEEYYDGINSQIDEVAEHILALGGQPLGTLKDYLNITKITEAENKKVDCSIVFNEVIKDYSTLVQDAANIKKSADEAQDYKTSALMDSFIEDYSKKLWMLKQSME